MYITDRHGMTLAIKVALNPNTTNHPTKSLTYTATLSPSLYEARYMRRDFQSIQAMYFRQVKTWACLRKD